MAGACSIYRDVDKFFQNLVENFGGMDHFRCTGKIGEKYETFT
jgi:hypothetical protein